MDILQELSQSLLNLNSGQSLPVVLQRLLDQKTRELAALTEINRAINKGEFSSALSCVAAEAKSLLRLDGVVIRAVEEAARLAVVAASGGGARASERSASGPSESLSAAVLEQNRPIVIRDIAHEAGFTSGYRERLIRRGFRSVLGVPLRIGDRTIGVMIGVSKREREFPTDEIELAAALSDQAALAIEQRRLSESAASAADEFAKLNAALEQAHRAKAKFMSAVSHELRTPLQVIIGSADLLKDGIVGASKAEQVRFLSAIVHHAEMLDGLIGNVLAVAKSDAKQTRLDISTAGIEDIMGNVLQYTSRVIDKESLKFSWTTESGLPPITTDVAKLEEILKHLVSNACKFTLSGTIDVHVAYDRDAGRFEFSVADSGIGIDEADLDKIFDEFYQVKKIQPKSYGGIGLGLSIAQRYALLLQGEIAVASRPEEGSTFTVRLPATIS